MNRRPPGSPLFPYTTLFRSDRLREFAGPHLLAADDERDLDALPGHLLQARLELGPLLASGRVRFHRFVRRLGDRKSTRLNSSHANISYAVFCLKKKNYK